SLSRRLATVSSSLMPLLFFFSFFFYCSVAHRDLHSFPTRRSSDLGFLRSGSGPHPGRLPRRPDAGRAARARDRRLPAGGQAARRSEEHTSELQSPCNLVCRLLLEKKKKKKKHTNQKIQ